MDKELTKQQNEDLKASNLVQLTEMYMEDVLDLPITVDEYSVRLYIAHRLCDIIGKYDANLNRYNNICEFVYQAYANHQVSIDKFINAIYNYMTEEMHTPSDRALTDGLGLFLDDYTYTQKSTEGI